MKSPLFYRPATGWCGDFIPYSESAAGGYHLFYLHDFRDPQKHGEGIPWYLLHTTDLVNFAEQGEVLARGGKDGQDLCVYTGSIIRAGGQYHVFYTGNNLHLRAQGKPQQAIMHAASPDLRRWTKIPEHTFFAPSHGYDPHNWRDPFVFWNAEEKQYHMLITARLTQGPARNRGCIALAVSPDLKAWTIRDPFWAPGLYSTLECPDLFRMGNWWYLVYSTFSERFATHYRMSRSPRGPWLRPADDVFDTRGYYAAKTAGDGDRRFLFGWLATRQEEKDDQPWQWGGSLVVHEIVQRADGTLGVKIPEAIPSLFGAPITPAPRIIRGYWEVQNESIASMKESGGFSSLLLGPMPETCMIETTIRYDPNIGYCGLLLRCDEEANAYYQVRIEPHCRRLVFDRWPRPGDQPFIFERPLPLGFRPEVRLQVLVDGTAVVVYADGQVALSCRMYEHRTGQWGLFAAEGSAQFEATTIRTILR